LKFLITFKAQFQSQKKFILPPSPHQKSSVVFAASSPWNAFFSGDFLSEVFVKQCQKHV
jgi:hypothetical protein